MATATKKDAVAVAAQLVEDVRARQSQLTGSREATAKDHAQVREERRRRFLAGEPTTTQDEAINRLERDLADLEAALGQVGDQLRDVEAGSKAAQLRAAVVAELQVEIEYVKAGERLHGLLREAASQARAGMELVRELGRANEAVRKSGGKQKMFTPWFGEEALIGFTENIGVEAGNLAGARDSCARRLAELAGES